MSRLEVVSLLFKTFFLAVILVGSFFTALGIAEAVETKRPMIQITPTPTVDRLAEPVLPSNPGQADYGEQAYWLHCMPCHGDRGQGLTVEFRNAYPPEDRNCWTSGCHGQRPYENGFTLPPTIPKLIGSGTLTKYITALDLYEFIHIAMPFQAPASLDEETYWTIIAFLLRENGVEGIPDLLFQENAEDLRLHPDTTANNHPQPTQDAAEEIEKPGDSPLTQIPSVVLAPGLVIFLVGSTIMVFLILHRRNKKP